MSDTVNAICRVEATSALERLPDGTSLPDRFRAAFKATQNHWMVTDPDRQMRAAIEAVYLRADEEEKERILEEMKALQALSALISGVPVDLERVEAPRNRIGIVDIYREVTAKDTSTP